MQISITEAQPVIHKILKIRAASMKKGYVFQKDTGRPGDCLIYVISGRSVYKTADGGSFPLSEKNVLYLRNGITYEMEALSDNYSYIFVEFCFSEGDFVYKNECFSAPDFDLETLFRRLIEADVQKKAGSKITCLTVLYQIYNAIIKSSTVPTAAAPRSLQIERANYDIKMNFQNPDYSIYCTAQKTGMSEAYFRKLFRLEYGMCPVQYLISLRISHAKNLLTYSKLRITDVAAESGFSDIYYFSRQFKKQTGLSPTEYKRYVNSY